MKKNYSFTFADMQQRARRWRRSPEFWGEWALVATEIYRWCGGNPEQQGWDDAVLWDGNRPWEGWDEWTEAELREYVAHLDD